MSNENYEMMDEVTTIETTEDYEVFEGDAEVKSKGGVGLAAILVGGGLAAVGLTVAAIKKFKNKKADKPKKQKTKLKLVRVPVESNEEVVDEASEEIDETIE